MDDFGDRFRQVRESLNLTQIRVARQAFDPDEPEGKEFNNTISKLEKGRLTNPTLDTLERLARGCGLTLPDLMRRMAEAGTKVSLPSGITRESAAAEWGSGVLSSPAVVVRTLGSLRRVLTSAAAVLAGAAAQLADLEQDSGLNLDPPDEPRRGGTDH